MITEFVYTWPDGKEEVRYRRPKDSGDSLEMVDQILKLQSLHGSSCPYSYRHVPETKPTPIDQLMSSFNCDREDGERIREGLE